MARLARITLPGYPHHIIQRGNNRQAIVAEPADYETLLGMLQESARKFGLAVHSYVLMSNHFHLLATPETPEAIPLTMQSVGRSYVRYFNRQQQRTGTLWEGRYRSTLIQTERYLLSCMVYIDLNPVRAGVVADAGDYRWSSFGHYAGLRHDKLVTPHPLYWQLGNTPFAREVAYGDLVRAGISGEVQQALTDSTMRGWAFGDADYVADLQRRTGRRLSVARAGRPPKTKL
jgi:putative transposase